MTHLRTAQVAVAVASHALLGFDLAGWLGPDKPERVAAIAPAVTPTPTPAPPSSTSPTSWSSNRPLLPPIAGVPKSPPYAGGCPRKRTGGRPAANLKTSNEPTLC